MNNKQFGFTLIELMIVVAIIGLLASIAMPMYNSYSIRAQISEGLALTAPLKSAVAEFVLDNGGFPPDNNAAALEAATEYAGSYVTSISVTDDVISILYGNRAHAVISGQTVTLTAINDAGSLTWVCASGGVISDTYLPSTCK